MRTEQELHALRLQLEASGLSPTNPRAHIAAQEFKEGLQAEPCVNRAVEFEARVRGMWIDDVLDPWCQRHGLTREQGISVAFKDSSFNAKDPSKDLITLKDVFSWGGQQNDFFNALEVKAEAAANSITKNPSAVPELKMTSVSTTKTPVVEISLLVHAAYLTKGFFEKSRSLETEGEQFDAQCSEYEVVEDIVGYANIVTQALSEVSARDIEHPGVFLYEVTEELGAWLRVNLAASERDFVVELVRKAEAFFECDCSFIATALVPNSPIKRLEMAPPVVAVADTTESGFDVGTGRGAVYVKNGLATKVAANRGFEPS